MADDGSQSLLMGERIRQAREARGLRQAEVATLAGFNRSVINDMENGRPRDLGVSKFYRLALVLGVSMEWLMGEPDLCPRMRADDWFEQIDWNAEPWSSLAHEARAMDIQPDDVRMLAGVSYHGQRPQNPAQWGLLMSVIRLAIQHPDAWVWRAPEYSLYART